MLSNKNILIVLLTLVYFVGAGVFFVPLNDYGEFQLSFKTYFVFDGLVVIFFIYVLVLYAKNKLPELKFNLLELSSLSFVMSLLLFSIGGFVSWSLNEYLHYFLRNQFYYFLLGVLLFWYSSRFDYEFIDKLTFSFFVIQALISIVLLMLEFFVGGERFLWEGTRLTGTMINHNTFGFVMVFYVYWFYISYNGTSKWFWLILAAALIVLSGSMTALLGAGMLFLSTLWGWLVLFSMALVVYLFFLDWFFGLHVVWKVNQIFFEDATHLTSLSAREIQYYYFLDAISDVSNWLFGMHVNNLYQRFDSQYYNIYFNVGLFPLLLFLFFAVNVIYCFRRTRYMLFYIWFFIVACSLTAFLSRPNAILLFFFFLAVTFLYITKSPQSSDKRYMCFVNHRG